MFQPCLPEGGPYEASSGIYPVMGKEKLGEGSIYVGSCRYVFIPMLQVESAKRIEYFLLIS